MFQVSATTRFFPGPQVTPGSLMAESEEELKSLLMKVKEESEKAGLKEKEGQKQRDRHATMSVSGFTLRTRGSS